MDGDFWAGVLGWFLVALGYGSIAAGILTFLIADFILLLQ